MRTILIAIAMCIALPATAQTATQVHVWKDAKGVTHYTQDPPPNGAYKVRSVARQPAAPTSAAGEAATATTVAERCVTARRNLDILADAGNRSIGLDADGDGKPDAPMSADERARQVQLAQASVRVHCKAGP